MAARIKGKMERTSSWSYLCRRVGFRAEKRTIGLRLIVTLKVVNSRQTAFGILPITKSCQPSLRTKENFQIGHLEVSDNLNVIAEVAVYFDSLLKSLLCIHKGTKIKWIASDYASILTSKVLNKRMGPNNRMGSKSDCHT